MEHEAFACPFCGAPYREIVPSGAVQVKCRYCGGTILVPPRLGGLVRRCPSHPETLAIGLCNDCRGSFCDHCLHIFTMPSRSWYEGPVDLYVCPNCLKKRHTKHVQRLMIFGVFYTLIISFSVMAMAASIVAGVLSILVLSMLVIAYGYYSKTHPWIKPTLHEKEMAKAEMLTIDARKLYERILRTYIMIWGSRESGERMLEKEIIEYMRQGHDREEAIRKVAVDELL